MFGPSPRLIIGEAYHWILADRMTYGSKLLGEIVEVPEGFATDLASIPRAFRFLISVNGNHRPAAIVHDYLYSKKGALTIKNKLVKVTRKQADQIFLEAMKELGVNFITRRVMYSAVRMGGWLHWSDK